MEVKIINDNPYGLPEYKTVGSAGMDLYSNLASSIVLQPLERNIIPTGIRIQLPIGYEAQVRPRSGAAAKYGVTVLNSPGTVDADYTGEIGVILVNLSTEPVTIGPGDRVAQLVVAKYESVTWSVTDKLEQTERGDNGYGHTGSR